MKKPYFIFIQIIVRRKLGRIKRLKLNYTNIYLNYIKYALRCHLHKCKTPSRNATSSVQEIMMVLCNSAVNFRLPM